MDIDAMAIQVRQLVELKKRVEPLLPMLEAMSREQRLADYVASAGYPEETGNPKQRGPQEPDSEYRARIIKFGVGGVRPADVYGSSGGELDTIGRRHGVDRLSLA